MIFKIYYVGSVCDNFPWNKTLKFQIVQHYQSVWLSSFIPPVETIELKINVAGKREGSFSSHTWKPMNFYIPATTL